ncbi:MAG: flagellar hook protein FlgE, partial [Betaproteobacteria bacterium]|nr:flagellar hook protein FlgE [Betaproteobacteria bacterium]
MSFQQGLSGLNAAAKNLDVIGNNVANSNTIGFKGSQAQFADVFANSLTGATGSAVGIGTSLSAVRALFGQGNINVSANPLDLAINGQGFFRVSANGTASYTRSGQFQLDKDGYIITANGSRLTGFAAGASGTVVTASPTDLQISRSDIPPVATAAAVVNVSLDSRSTAMPAAKFNLNDPSTYHSATSMSVYDSLGNAHTLSLYFLKTASNAWSVFGANDGVQIGATSTTPLGTLKFDSAGAIDTTATSLPFNISTAVATGATTPLAFTLDFAGSTQFGSSYGVNALNQDGSTSGRLSGFAIGSGGIVLGRYTNGETRAQGQIVLGNFPNPQGL